MAATAAIAAAAFSLAQYLEETDEAVHNNLGDESPEAYSSSTDEDEEEYEMRQNELARIRGTKIVKKKKRGRVPRVVSWSDERGGDLVIESGRERSGSKSAPTLGEMRRAKLRDQDQDHEYEGERREAVGCANGRLLDAATKQCLEDALFPAEDGGNNGLPIKSPGWGWYVAITPPTPQYENHMPLIKGNSKIKAAADTAEYPTRETNMSEGEER